MFHVSEGARKGPAMNVFFVDVCGWFLSDNFHCGFCIL